MEYFYSRKVLSGFCAVGPDPDVPLLKEFGEHWTPESWEMWKHTHDYWELYCQIEGSREWRFGRKRCTLSAGQGYLVAPDIEHHSPKSDLGSERHSFVTLDLGKLWKNSSRIRQVTSLHVLPDTSKLETLLGLLVEEGGREKYSSEILKRLVELIALELERTFEGLETSGARDHRIANAPRSILRARNLLRERPGQNWRVEDLGRLVGMSANHLTTTFGDTLGMTPMRYLQNCRIEKAKELLKETELSATFIAHELGFSSLQHFSTCFKKWTGASPSEFRSKV